VTSPARVRQRVNEARRSLGATEPSTKRMKRVAARNGRSARSNGSPTTVGSGSPARDDYLDVEKAGDLERTIRRVQTLARKSFAKDDSRRIRALEYGSQARDHLQLALGFVARAERECAREPDAVDDGSRMSQEIIRGG